MTDQKSAFLSGSGAEGISAGGARESCGATKVPDVLRANLDKTFIPNYELSGGNSIILFDLLAIRALDMPNILVLLIALAAIALRPCGIPTR